MAVPLFAELKRRRVFRALLGYAVVAFAVLQVIEPVTHGLKLPDWTLSFVVVGLAAGFPVVLALAWIFDVSRRGIERTVPLGSPGEPRPSTVLVALIAFGIALAGAAVLVFRLASRGGAQESASSTPLPAGPSVAVLPFVNMSAAKDDEYFSDGITEEVINALAQVDGIRVVSRTSAFAYKGKNLSVRKIGEELAVSTVLEGSVRRQGTDVRIAAQLINVADGYHLWSKTYDRRLENVFAVEDELARSIADSLTPQLLKRGATLVREATASTEAHDLYLRGRHFWNKRTADDLERAIALFQQALDVDPGYALAHAGLADTYALLAEYSFARPMEVLPKATAHARKALQLNEMLAEPHAALGLIGMYEYDWRSAEREFRRAIELRPGYVTAHHWYAMLLSELGRFPEARAQAQQALRLDPASLIASNTLALVLYDARDYEGAIEASRRTLELDPGFAVARGLLAFAYAGAGKKQEALAQLAAVTDVDIEHTAMRACVLAATGDREEALRLARELLERSRREPIRPGILAAVYGLLGDRDHAFEMLDRAYEEKEWTLRELKVGPIWDTLRDDPRFVKLLAKMNFN